MKMKKNSFVILLAGLGLFLASCKKEYTEYPVDLPSENELKTFFDERTLSATQYFSAIADTSNIIVGKQGTIITIAPKAFYTGKLSSPVLVKGNVSVELVEVYSRADMVMMNKTTMGKLVNGKLSAMSSGGFYRLNITQNGKAVNVFKGKLIVSLPKSKSKNENLLMGEFEGTFDTEGDIVWKQVDDSVKTAIDSLAGGYYTIADTTFGWTNVDRFFEDPRPKTTLNVKLPNGFDNTNTKVFVTYDGQPTALANLDVFTNEGYFSEHYGQIPIGMQIHIIAMTRISGKLHYNIVPATIEDGKIYYVTTLEPTDEVKLRNLITALP